MSNPQCSVSEAQERVGYLGSSPALRVLLGRGREAELRLKDSPLHKVLPQVDKDVPDSN